ncbi:LysM peptidoglycan-binding domain-containing protein [Oceanobacillus sp. CAU 1775]
MKIHIVQKGDTLWEISQKYNVDFEELKELNAHLASPDMIMPGMKIRIPSTGKLKESKKKTSPKEKVVTPKAEPKTIPKPTEPTKKLQITESPKLQGDKSITLPSLEGMDDFYPTTMFPEVKKEKEKAKEAKPKTQPKQIPKQEVPKQPKESYVQPTQQMPMYQSPIDNYYAPCTNMAPAHYCPCCQHQAMMPYYNHMPTGCCGQQSQPMYSPYAMQQNNHYQQPAYSMPYPSMKQQMHQHTMPQPPMQQPMYQQQMNQQQIDQLYPTNDFSHFDRKNEPEFFPRPPAVNEDSATDKEKDK